MNRYGAVALLFVLSLITYVDRAAISSVKDALQTDLMLDDRSIGAVFSAFSLGYALAQIPAGWFADKAGPRLMLTIVVAAWSLLTAATGLAGSLAAMLAIRFFFGVAEAGAYPGTARAFYSWLPRSQHGRANGIVFSGSRLGAAGAFPLMASLAAAAGWRNSFFWLALPGLAWAAVWYLWFRDRPARPIEEHTPEENAGAVPSLSEILRTRVMTLAMIQYFATNFTTFLCLSWMNPYLKQRYSLSLSEAAWYTMAILLVAATAQWFAGIVVDKLFAGAMRQRSRQIPAMIGFAISAAGALAIPFASTPAAASLFFAVAAFGAEMTISPSWAFCMDIGGANAGAVSGAMNMAGNIGSFVSANAFPWLQGITGDASAYFFLVAVLNGIGVLCWTRMGGQAGKSGATATG